MSWGDDEGQAGYDAGYRDGFAEGLRAGAPLGADRPVRDCPQCQGGNLKGAAPCRLCDGAGSVRPA